jgi:hypothetical protein
MLHKEARMCFEEPLHRMLVRRGSQRGVVRLGITDSNQVLLDERIRESPIHYLGADGPAHSACCHGDPV